MGLSHDSPFSVRRLTEQPHRFDAEGNGYEEFVNPWILMEVIRRMWYNMADFCKQEVRG